jgi:hypothetical protein
MLLGALVLSGCTLVPTSSNPSMVRRGQVPFGLLDRTIPGTNNGRVRFITQPVYIIDASGHLAPSSRIVPAPAQLGSVLRELIIGPTDIETAAGYSSSLPKGLVILDATIKGEIGTINLARSLSTLSRQDQIKAIGQLVYTSNDVGASKGLIITVAGVAQLLPRPKGGNVKIATEADYQSLLNI